MFRLNIGLARPISCTRSFGKLRLSPGLSVPRFTKIAGTTTSTPWAINNSIISKLSFGFSRQFSTRKNIAGSKIDVIPTIQKRFATFNQLGRNTLNRTTPKYNNTENNIFKPFIFVTIFTVLVYFTMPLLFNNTPLSYFKKHPQHLVWTIIGLNVLVFGLWQIRYSNAFLYKVLERDFILDTSSLSRKTNSSLILSSFSHQEPWHLLMNMLCLYSFSGSMMSVLGIESFMSLYLIAGAWSSYFSIAYAQIFKRFNRSLGASGSISGVFTSFATVFPNAGVSLFFIPIPGGASTAAGLFALYNLAGCFARWGSFDYAAHLGGMWVGLLWGFYLRWKAQKDEEERRARLRRFGW